MLQFGLLSMMLVQMRADDEENTEQTLQDDRRATQPNDDMALWSTD